jgi:HEAT repeat protein
MIDDSTLSEKDRALLDALKHLPPVPRRADLADQFRDRLRTERIAGPVWRPWLITAIAAMLVLAIGGGWWLGRRSDRAEVSQLRAQLSDALDGASAPRRFEAINVAGKSSVRDQQVVDALTRALLADPNTNVRVAAAEALGRVADNQSLASAAAQSFGKERSPFVQAELLRSISRLNVADRRRIVEPLLVRSDVDSSVRLDAARISGI